MDRDLSEELLQLACDANLCNQFQREWKDRDKIGLVQFYKENPDWCLERQYPTLDYLERNFNSEEVRKEGVYVSIFVDGDILDEQVYIFVNCTGTAYIKFDAKKKIFPMIYLSEGSRMTFIVDGSSTPFQLYDNSKVKVECINGGKHKIYKCDSV